MTATAADHFPEHLHDALPDRDITCRGDNVHIAHAPATVDLLAVALTAVAEPDANLDAIAYLLRKVAETPAEDIDPSPYRVQERLKTVCWIVARQLAAFDAEVRAAPPSWLGEVVRESLQPCAGPGCDEQVASYADAYCTPDCSARAFHAFGEV